MLRFTHFLAATVLVAAPLSAQDKPKAAEPAKAAEAAKPISQQDVSAKDVAATPMTDLGLRKGEIPKLLLDAQERPYELDSGTGCSKLIEEVAAFDAMLGHDADIDAAANRGLQAGRVAQSVIGAFIPFRGVIREVSGASAQDRKLRSAINAGNARRGFLKGMGLSRGCAYPARPASAKDAARILAEEAAADPKNKDKQEAAARAAVAAKLPVASGAADAAVAPATAETAPTPAPVKKSRKRKRR